MNRIMMVTQSPREREAMGELQIKERPILFSAPMVRAILAGQKTQTRRVVRLPYHADAQFWEFSSLLRASVSDDNMPPFALQATFLKNGTNSGTWVRCPYSDGEFGDRPWVRETFYEAAHGDVAYPATFESTADDEECAELGMRKRPSIFMRRAQSRITLEVTRVRIERLHKITEEDARAEGVGPDTTQLPPNNTHRWAFRRLWDRINGDRSPWNMNPWVWAVEFKRVEDGSGRAAQRRRGE